MSRAGIALMVAMCVVGVATQVAAAKTPPDADPSPESEALVAAGTLHLDDLPTGWRETPVAAEQVATPSIPACAGLRRLQRQGIAGGRSNLFSVDAAPGADTAYASVTVYPSVKSARHAQSSLLHEPMLRCLVAGTVAQVAEVDPDAKTTSHVKHIAVPMVGDDAGGLAHNVRIVDADGTRTYVNQTEFIRVGRAVVALHVNTMGTSDLTTVRDRAARVLAARLSAVAGSTSF